MLDRVLKMVLDGVSDRILGWILTPRQVGSRADHAAGVAGGTLLDLVPGQAAPFLSAPAPAVLLASFPPDGVALVRYGGETTVRSTGEEVTIHPWATFLETPTAGALGGVGCRGAAPGTLPGGGRRYAFGPGLAGLGHRFQARGPGDVPFRSGLPGPAPGGGQSRWLPHFQLHFGERRPHPGPPRGLG